MISQEHSHVVLSDHASISRNVEGTESTTDKITIQTRILPYEIPFIQIEGNIVRTQECRPWPMGMPALSKGEPLTVIDLGQYIDISIILQFWLIERRAGEREGKKGGGGGGGEQSKARKRKQEKPKSSWQQTYHDIKAHACIQRSSFHATHHVGLA